MLIYLCSFFYLGDFLFVYETINFISEISFRGDKINPSKFHFEVSKHDVKNDFIKRISSPYTYILYPISYTIFQYLNFVSQFHLISY